MILRLYLFSLYSTAIISAGLAGMIIFNINPFDAPFWMIMIFYVSVFLLLLAIFGLIGFYLKVWATNREVIFAHIIPTLRQAALMAVAIAGLLFLQQLRVLNWWVGILFILAIIFVELFFRGRKK